MKLEKDVSHVPLEQLNNYCIENDFEIEIRQRTPYIQLIEVIQE